MWGVWRLSVVTWSQVRTLELQLHLRKKIGKASHTKQSESEEELTNSTVSRASSGPSLYLWSDATWIGSTLFEWWLRPPPIYLWRNQSIAADRLWFFIERLDEYRVIWLSSVTNKCIELLINKVFKYFSIIQIRDSFKNKLF